MKVTTFMRAQSLLSLVLAVLLVVCTVGAFGQGNGRTYVAGEMLVSVRAGTTRAAVDQMAAGVNAAVLRAWGSLDSQNLTETYHLRIGDGASIKDATTLQAINTLKQNQTVTYADVNKLGKWLDSTPNDPRYREQWHLSLLNMPQAWDLEKGQDTVIIAILDSGCDITHPDLVTRIYKPFGANGNPSDLTDNVPHGTHVLGIAGAATDNGTGVAGITWQNVKMMPVKLGDLPSSASAITGMQYADTNGATIMNMSFTLGGSPDPPDLTNPVHALMLTLAKKGTIFTVAAGNSGPTDTPGVPSVMARAHNNIYSVASCGRTKSLAPYSSFHPYNTITTPGGDQSASLSDGILSTLPVNNQGPYGFEQGTSMAAPALAGVVGILRSVPGVSDSDIRDALITTTSPSFNPPSPGYGYGVVDGFAALLKVAVSVTILEPDGTGGKASSSGLQPPPVETLRPKVRIAVRNVLQTNLVVQLDGTAVTNYTIENVTRTVPGPNNTQIPTSYEVFFQQDMGPGQHVLDVGGSTPGPPPRTVTDKRFFSIIPHNVAQGRSLISIPYYQQFQSDGITPVTPEYYFGTDFRLARWLPDQQRYVFYTSFGPKEPGASFMPPDSAPHPDGSATPTYPLGLAFWSDTESIKPILTKGDPLTDRSFVIPLRGNGSGDRNFVSWNMVGDPFNFDVPFNACFVDTPEGRLSIAVAVDKGYILPVIYTFGGLTGYEFRVLPDGLLRVWQGHWIGVVSRTDIALVVPPLKSSRAAALPSRAAVSGTVWSLRLRASSGNLRDTFNFIGTASKASDGYDLSKILKPPAVSPYVALGIRHDDWGTRSGLFAQDIRSQGGVKNWNVVVDTDQADSNVTLTWDSTHSLPRDLKLTIKDESNGQVADMRTRSSMTFSSGTAPGPRRFTITASPKFGNGVRISNVVVTQPAGGRASGTSNIGFTLSGDATYEVKVMSMTGKVVSPIASRAAGPGDVRVVWNGKDSANRAVPAGTYIVQIRAIGSDGDTVRVITPFSMLR